MEIFWNRTWAGLSDHTNWTEKDADVVCKQLHHANGSGTVVYFYPTIILTFIFNFVKVLLWNIEQDMKLQRFISVMYHALGLKTKLRSVFTTVMLLYSATMRLWELLVKKVSTL